MLNHVLGVLRPKKRNLLGTKKVKLTVNDPTEFWLWIGKIALVGVVIVAIYIAMQNFFPTFMQDWFNKLNFTSL